MKKGDLNQNDLTAPRKETEAVLRQSEEQYRSLVEFLPMAVAVHCNGIYVYMNPAGVKLFGASSLNEIIGRRVLDLLHPDYREIVAARIKEIDEHGVRTPAMESKILRLDGESANVEAMATPIIYMGKPSVQVFFRDITERKRAEETLRESETKYRIVAENTYDWEFWLSPAGEFLYISPSCKRITGHDAEAFIKDPGLLTRIIVHPEDRAHFESHLHKVRECPAPAEIEFCITHTDGTWRWINHVCQPVFDADGRFLGTRGSNRDISQRKALEDQLRRSYDELELRVQERTVELARTNEELQSEIAERKETVDRIKTTNALLKLFTQKITRKEYLDAAVEILRTWSGCHHVGMLIADGEGNILYGSCAGFGQECKEMESLLSVQRDHCASTGVVTGDPKPKEAPAMTPNGSFYSNSMIKFVAGLTKDEKARYREACVRSGFATVAVIPIRYREQAIGAIHVADEREGKVSLQKVEFLEVLAFIIGEAVYKFDVEGELRHNYDVLRENNELLENMFSTIHVKIAYLDTEFNFVRVNRTYAEADEKTPDFFPGKNHFDLYPHEENKAIFQKVVDTGEPYFAYERAFEYAEHPERGVTYWDWSLVPVKEPDNGVIGVVLSLIDVTERKRVETERARLAAAVDSTAEAVVITDQRGMIQYVNPAFEQVTGYSRNESVGRDLHFLDSGKQDETFYKGIRDTLVRAGVWRGRIIQKRKDGTEYEEECVYSPVKDDSGRIVNYVSIKRDVTERLRLESIAEAVNTMENIGYIFSGVRHEIGNPINSINMILGILKAKLDTLSKESIREYVDRTMSQVSRVDYLLKSLKSFNMYETLDIRDVRILSFMEKFLPLVKDDFAKTGITIESRISPEADSVSADARALQQVLLNVITNASDALVGRKDPKISINAWKIMGMVLIRVKDNGCGMTAEQLKDVFKPFCTTKAQGTGLGLVITRKMLAKMNGTIEIVSQKDKGTTVNIFIPEGKCERTQP
jgi:PAS domain S-box-containing protein